MQKDFMGSHKTNLLELADINIGKNCLFGLQIEILSGYKKYLLDE